jgi:prepilin-type N-terminal cleavage/methylation domain-containing protein
MIFPNCPHLSPRARRHQLTALAYHHAHGGFSLVELLVASVIMTIAVVGSVTLTQRSGATSSAASARYQQQSLVDADVARIRRLNDRFTCFSGTCTSAGTTDPGKNDYFPTPVGAAPNIINSTAGDNFEALCRSTVLITQLVADIGTTPPSALTSAGVTYTIDTSNQGEQPLGSSPPNLQSNLHRYTVTYTSAASGEVLRRVTFVPTTVSWCP